MDTRFKCGQLIKHRLFEYRGVIVDVDPEYRGPKDWYKQQVENKDRRSNRPWYKILVHNSNVQTYVAERNLHDDTEGKPVSHPEIKKYFSNFKRGNYLPKSEQNA